jgi:hypothetical protein
VKEAMSLHVTPHLHYRDPDAARLWLERAFGLETDILVTDAEGRLVFARLTHRRGCSRHRYEPRSTFPLPLGEE